jgi:hypothetical protein
LLQYPGHRCDEEPARQLLQLGPDHRDTLATRHNLARWPGAAGAAAALEELLQDRLRVLGLDTPDASDAT